MDTAIAAALAREAMKRKPGLEHTETNTHKKQQENVDEGEPERLVALKKSEAPQKKKESFEVNAEPAVAVQLKKMELQDKPKAVIPTAVLPAVQLRKTTPKSSTTSDEASSAPQAEPQVMVKLKKTQVAGKKTTSTSNNATTVLPAVTLRYTEGGGDKSIKNKNDASHEVDFGVKLRKPGQGRLKHLEKFYSD
jgi:hypothetical protein